MAHGHTTEMVVFVVLFLLVSGLGFVAARWRRPDSMHSLDEWGLGGRSFGSWITWFLIGGDLYTAYTFVAVPALVFGAGAAGFYAVPYTIVVYPLVFLVLIRLWSVSHVHGFVTPADFVRARFGSPTLALVIAITGIVATMPYIALQLVGIRSVLTVLGLGSGSNPFMADIPLIIAFVVLAAYTYTGGLRAPALIAIVKDILIYIAIIVAIAYLPAHFGGWGGIFDAAEKKLGATNPATVAPPVEFAVNAAPVLLPPPRLLRLDPLTFPVRQIRFGRNFRLNINSVEFLPWDIQPGSTGDAREMWSLRIFFYRCHGTRPC